MKSSRCAYLLVATLHLIGCKGQQAAQGPQSPYVGADSRAGVGGGSAAAAGPMHSCTPDLGLAIGGYAMNILPGTTLPGIQGLKGTVTYISKSKGSSKIEPTFIVHLLAPGAGQRYEMNLEQAFSEGSTVVVNKVYPVKSDNDGDAESQR